MLMFIVRLQKIHYFLKFLVFETFTNLLVPWWQSALPEMPGFVRRQLQSCGRLRTVPFSLDGWLYKWQGDLGRWKRVARDEDHFLPERFGIGEEFPPGDRRPRFYWRKMDRSHLVLFGALMMATNTQNAAF